MKHIFYSVSLCAVLLCNVYFTGSAQHPHSYDTKDGRIFTIANGRLKFGEAVQECRRQGRTLATVRARDIEGVRYFRVPWVVRKLIEELDRKSTMKYPSNKKYYPSF